MDKKKPYITSLKEDNEALKKENEELKKTLNALAEKVDTIADSKTEKIEQVEKVEETKDDRDEKITIHYGAIHTNERGQRVYITKELPKREAFEELVTYYSTQKYKIVPKPNADYPGMNLATCYCRIGKRDRGTGRKVTAIQEMPIWLAATRALEGSLVELISKEEYDKYHNEKARIEDQWKEDTYKAKRIQLIDALKNTL